MISSFRSSPIDTVDVITPRTASTAIHFSLRPRKDPRLCTGGEAVWSKTPRSTRRRTAASDGYLIASRAFADVQLDAEIMREKVFGPPASIAPFRTEEEVITKPNDSTHCLSAAISTGGLNEAFGVSSAVQGSDQVTVNSWGDMNANAPFGVTNESRFERDMRRGALECWTVCKTVNWRMASSNSVLAAVTR